MGEEEGLWPDEEGPRGTLHEGPRGGHRWEGALRRGAPGEAAGVHEDARQALEAR